MTDIVKKLLDSDTLVDVMIQIEDFLDNLDLYAFKNWFDGTLVDGPDISKYWISVVLMYDYDKMPDPAGALRLVNAGVKVEYKEAKIENTDSGSTSIIDLDQIMTLQGGQDSQGTTLEPYDFQEQDRVFDNIWLVRITIPRDFINELVDITLASFDNDVEQSLQAEYGDKEPASNQNIENNDMGDMDDMGDME